MTAALLAPRHLEVQRSFDKKTPLLLPAAVNLGNLLFRSAVADHVRDFEWVDESMNPKEVADRYEIVVLPLANLLTPWSTGGLGAWATSAADFLEAVGLPVMALGMGAQARLGDHSDLGLSDEIVKLARVISEHSISIGVRGEFTADVLAGVGIRNTVIIGCPSNFISQSPALGGTIQTKQEAGVPGRIVFSGRDFDFRSSDLHRKAQTRLLDQAELHRGFYVIQAQQEAIRLTRRDRRDSAADSYRDQLRRYLRPWNSDDQFRSLIDQRFLSFPSTHAWLEFLSSADLHVGMRIHGSIAATQAGTPSVTVLHDSRTQELCETIGLPSISVEEFCDATCLPEIVERHAFDGKRYDDRRRQLAETYTQLYAANGLKCAIAVS